MRTRCVVDGCKNTSVIKKKTALQIELEKTKKITFHTFPSEPKKRAKWVKILNLDDKIVGRNSRICSVHFNETFIDRTSLVCVRLKENAIPHVIEDTLYDKIEDEITIKEEDIITPEIEEIYLPSFENTEHVVAEDVSFERYSLCDRATNTSPSSSAQTSRQINDGQELMVDKGTQMSPERIWNTSIYKEIRKSAQVEIDKLRKRVKCLQQTVRRKDKKISTVDNILDNMIKQKYQLGDNDDNEMTNM